MITKLHKVIDAQNLLYKAFGLESPELIPEDESKEYSAHSYTLGNRCFRFRIAKKTPTKSGQFVTMWKRINEGTIAPYDQSDNVDFFIIHVVEEDKIGQFVFPKSVLIEKGIFSKNHKGGKRAIRLYAPWDETHSIQAVRTQEWQNKYFIDITPSEFLNIESAKKLYFMCSVLD